MPRFGLSFPTPAGFSREPNKVGKSRSMSYNLVFRFLVELFPQVDLRVLKAVAIEHADDVDAAALFVLSEVLPCLGEHSEESLSLNVSPEPIHQPNGVWMHKQDNLSNQGVEDENEEILLGPSVACASALSDNHTHGAHIRSPCTGAVTGVSQVEADKPNEADFLLRQHEVVYDPDASLSSESIMPLECTLALESGHVPDNFHWNSQLMNETVAEEPLEEANEALEEQDTSTYQRFKENGYGNLHGNNVQEPRLIEDNGTVTPVCTDLQTFSFSIVEKNPESISSVEEGKKNICENKSSEQLVDHANIQKLCDLGADNSVLVGLTSLKDISSSILKSIPAFMDSQILLTENINIPVAEHETQCTDCLAGNVETVTVSGAGNSECTAIATQSGQVVGIDFLEGLITDTKINKQTLVSGLQSVRSMVAEVETNEERAYQAKEEALRAGQVILSKVGDLKPMTKHAKEANDMHAGEVYGEKAILATEARELQSRLLKLSAQRDQSLLMIEEIRRTLEERLAAAREVMEAAEHEKLEKEKLASKLLEEEELIMNETVLESRRLEQEAEENYELREFMMDRGRVVDALQGEIAVICEDVMMLKEKVDGRVPLSKSRLSTACSMASSSSSSSYRRVSLDLPLGSVDNVEEIINKELSETQYLDNSANILKGIYFAEKAPPIDDSRFDDWELFENEGF